MESEPKYNKYLFSYSHDGANWSFHIPATSVEDAQERISKMQFVNYDGILLAELPATSKIGAALFCWLKNLWKRY